MSKEIDPRLQEIVEDVERRMRVRAKRRIHFLGEEGAVSQATASQRIRLVLVLLRRIENEVGIFNESRRLQVQIFDRTKLGYREIVGIILGRELDTDEEVHHLDCNHNNNQPKNLAIIPSTIHRKIHDTVYPPGYKSEYEVEGHIDFLEMLNEKIGFQAIIFISEFWEKLIEEAQNETAA